MLGSVTLLPIMKQKFSKRLATDFEIHFEEIKKRRSPYGHWQFEYVLYYVCSALIPSTGEVAGPVEYELAHFTYECMSSHTKKKRARREIGHSIAKFLTPLTLDNLSTQTELRMLQLARHVPSLSTSITLSYPNRLTYELIEAIRHLPSEVI